MEPKLTPVNTILILVNIAVMLLVMFGGVGIADMAYYMGAVEAHAVMEQGEYYRLLTGMFLHFDTGHLFQNMLFLAVVGCYLECALGSVRYLLFYLLSGAGAGFCSVGYHLWMNYAAVSVGASGAVFGVVGGLLCLVLRNRGRYVGIGTGGILFMIAGSLYYGFSSGGIDNAAHIGGLLCGFLLGFLFYRKKKTNLRGKNFEF